MNLKMPRVREFMTPLPHTVGAEETLRKAQTLMKEYGVRHLPVKKDGKLIGIVSERNLKEALGSLNGALLKMEDVMIPDPFHVTPQTPLDEVAGAMAEEKYGCALVQEEGRLIGIFTTVDACRALRQILETFT